jgi:hypothetical protein
MLWKKLKKIYEFKKYKICQKPYILKVRKKSKRKPRRGTGEKNILGTFFDRRKLLNTGVNTKVGRTQENKPSK